MEVYDVLGMSHAEVIEAMGLNLNTTLTMIQFWVTATFGMIVAFHFAGERLTRNLVMLVSGLYAATVLTSLSAYVQSGMSMIAWAEAGELYVIHHGLMTQGDFEIAVLFRNSSIYGGALLIVLGSIATVYYGLHVRKNAAAVEVESAPEGEEAT